MEKRMNFSRAFIDEIVKVRKEHNRPDFVISFRLTPEETGEEGLTMDESLALVDILCEQTVQYLHVSLHDFFSKVHRGKDAGKTRMQAVSEAAAGRLPVMGVGSVYAQ